MSAKELEESEAEPEVYDESCYPGAAEDELELESTEQTCLAMDDGLPPPDVTCSICSDILIDPVSLHCGHTFCQLCLARVWKSRGKSQPSNITCPVCRLPWRNFPGVNITLRYGQLGSAIYDFQSTKRESERAQERERERHVPVALYLYVKVFVQVVVDGHKRVS